LNLSHVLTLAGLRDLAADYQFFAPLGEAQLLRSRSTANKVAAVLTVVLLIFHKIRVKVVKALRLSPQFGIHKIKKKFLIYYESFFYKLTFVPVRTNQMEPSFLRSIINLHACVGVMCVLQPSILLHYSTTAAFSAYLTLCRTRLYLKSS
jgi:hypothetical protein